MEQTFKMEKYNFNAYDGNNFCTKEFRTQINYQFIKCREHFLFTSELFLYDHVGIFGFYFKYLKMRGFVSFVKFKLFFVPSKFSSDF